MSLQFWDRLKLAWWTSSKGHCTLHVSMCSRVLAKIPCRTWSIIVHHRHWTRDELDSFDRSYPLVFWFAGWVSPIKPLPELFKSSRIGCWLRESVGIEILVGTTPYKFITKSGEIRFDTVVSGMWKWGIHRIHPKCPSNRDRNDSRLDFGVARCEKNRHQLVVSSTHPDDRWKLIMFGVGKSSKSMGHGVHS